MESMGPLMATAFGEPRPSRPLKMLTPRADVANRAIRTQNSAPWIPCSLGARSYRERLSQRADTGV
jgi:hypothetical protein